MDLPAEARKASLEGHTEVDPEGEFAGAIGAEGKSFIRVTPLQQQAQRAPVGKCASPEVKRTVSFPSPIHPSNSWLLFVQCNTEPIDSHLAI